MKPFALKRYWPSFLLVAFASIVITILYVTVSDKQVLDAKKLQFETVAGDNSLLKDLQLNVESHEDTSNGTIAFNDGTLTFSENPISWQEKLDQQYDSHMQSLQNRYRNFMRPFQYGGANATPLETDDAVVIANITEAWFDEFDNSSAQIDLALLQKETEAETHFSVTVDLPGDTSLSYVQNLEMVNNHLYAILDVYDHQTDMNSNVLLNIDMDKQVLTSSTTMLDDIAETQGTDSYISLHGLSPTPTPTAWFLIEQEGTSRIAGYDATANTSFFLEQEGKNGIIDRLLTFNDMLYAISTEDQFEVNVYNIVDKTFHGNITTDITLPDEYYADFLIKDGLMYVLNIDHSYAGIGNLYVIDVNTGAVRYHGKLSNVSSGLYITFGEDEL
ncbi:hypothetical protein NSQ26_13340 [Bacillus sp. FSL W7-1360]